MLPYFDEEELLKPSMIARERNGIPNIALMIWSQRLLDSVKERFKPKTISTFRCGLPCPIYGIKYKGKEIVCVLLPIGAPVSAGFMEEYIACGVKRFVCIGTCGSLSSLTHGNIIVPTQAYRDEGTSWHYVEHDSNWIDVSTSIETDVILESLGVPHICGKVWTTDAFYRETPSAVKIMKEQGCLAVEMECAANMAVAKFRGVDCYQLLFANDSFEDSSWKASGFGKHKGNAYDKLVEIALEVAISS